MALDMDGLSDSCATGGQNWPGPPHRLMPDACSLLQRQTQIESLGSFPAIPVLKTFAHAAIIHKGKPVAVIVFTAGPTAAGAADPGY